MRRDCLMTTKLHTYVNRIVAQCLAWDIDTLVLGINHGWKQGANMGKKNNQTFVSIPFYKFQQVITYKTMEAGIQVVEQEESYTSKASFLDMDPIPVYGTEEAKTANFSGHRVSRGRYQTGNKSR